MKKILCVLVLVAAGVNFAHGFEIGVSGFSATSGDVTIAGGGLNIANTGYFNQVLGLGIYGNIMYGSYYDVTVIPIDLLLGVALKGIDNNSLALPVVFGLYAINTFAFGEEAAVQGFNIGAGGNITAQLKFGGSGYLYLRLQMAYEFLGGGEFIISPAIGIGF